MTSGNANSVAVIGAGIQGVCIGLNLIKKGFKVTIVDRDEPGKNSASYGNAGHFSPYASLSMNRPDVLIDVPSMLLSTTGPLALRWNYVPKMIPWFLKFIKNCTKKKMMHTAKYMHQILDLALPAYDELFQEIDISGLVESRGIIYFWTDRDLKSRELEINVRKELGVEQQLLKPHEIHDLEPHIKQISLVNSVLRQESKSVVVRPYQKRKHRPLSSGLSSSYQRRLNKAFLQHGSIMLNFFPERLNRLLHFGQLSLPHR